MKWNCEKEEQLIKLKEQGYSTAQIAQKLGTTISSVKHKYTRLQQKQNADTHHHPEEKQKQIAMILKNMDRDIYVLETHAGYGNLTELYSVYAKEVLCYETDKEKHEYINQLGCENVACLKTDSLKEMHLNIYQNLKFNVIDVDPYGFPSKYFPDIFDLIDDGFLFVTLPKYGCAQINNITKHHVKIFYGFEGGNNEEFLQCFINTLENQALRTYKHLEVVNVIDLQKVYRIAMRIKKKNAFELCGYKHLLKKEG